MQACRSNKTQTVGRKLQAVAPPAEVADVPQAKYEAMLKSAEGREELADRLGYRKIGAELPDDISLSTVIKSLPKDVCHVLLKTGKRFTFIGTVAIGVFWT